MGKVVKEMCGRNLRDKTDGDICQSKNSLLVFSYKRTRRCILIFISYFSMFISHTVSSDANLALAQNSRWSAPAFQMVAKKLFVHSKLVARLIVYSRWGK